MNQEPVTGAPISPPPPPVEVGAPGFFCKVCGAHHHHWSLAAQLYKSIQLLRQSSRIDKPASAQITEREAANGGVESE